MRVRGPLRASCTWDRSSGPDRTRLTAYWHDTGELPPKAYSFHGMVADWIAQAFEHKDEEIADLKEQLEAANARARAAATTVANRDELLARGLAWPGRGEDEVQPIERATMKVVGHADECELVEYGVCTCALADATRELQARVHDEDCKGEVVAGSCVRCGIEVAT